MRTCIALKSRPAAILSQVHTSCVSYRLILPKLTLGLMTFAPPVSNISRPLEQADNRRPAEAPQEFLIRVREGLTRKIFEHASGHSEEGNEDAGPIWGTDVPIKAWTEGPCALLSSRSYPLYCTCSLTRHFTIPDGHESYLSEDYSTLVLISGGSGVSYALSNAMDIVRRKRAMHLGHTSHGIAIATERLSFIWVVKTAGAPFGD